MVFINRPKVVFDEYLLGMQVLDAQRPAIFMLDMGSWLFQQKVYQKNIEKHTDFCHRGGLNQDVKHSKEESVELGIYETIDMKFIDLSLHYTPFSAERLVKNNKNYMFPVFEKLNLGLQVMSMLN